LFGGNIKYGLAKPKSKLFNSIISYFILWEYYYKPLFKYSFLFTKTSLNLQIKNHSNLVSTNNANIFSQNFWLRKEIKKNVELGLKIDFYNFF